MALLMACGTMLPAPANASSVRVNSVQGLRQALASDAISVVELTRDLVIDAGAWPESAAVTIRRRSVMVRSPTALESAPQNWPLLDVAYLRHRIILDQGNITLGYLWLYRARASGTQLAFPGECKECTYPLAQS